MLLAACSAGGDPLDGSSWKLSEYAGKPALPETNVTIEFTDGQAGGAAGCNSYGGAYEVNGEQVVFRDVVSTLMLCTAPEGVMEQEAEFLGSLNEVERFEVSGGQLQLIRADGEALVFVPAQ
jgi:heat shock protein HslJ